MSDSELMRLANQAGLEKEIVRDLEGLANRYGLAKALYHADLLTHAEYMGIQLNDAKTFKRVRMP